MGTVELKKGEVCVVFKYLRDELCLQRVDKLTNEITYWNINKTDVEPVDEDGAVDEDAKQKFKKEHDKYLLKAFPNEYAETYHAKFFPAAIEAAIYSKCRMMRRAARS